MRVRLWVRVRCVWGGGLKMGMGMGMVLSQALVDVTIGICDHGIRCGSTVAPARYQPSRH